MADSSPDITGVLPRRSTEPGVLRLIELVVVFFVFPIGVALLSKPGILFPVLWVTFLLVLLFLILDRRFDNRRLGNLRYLWRVLPNMFARFAVLSLVIAALILSYDLRIAPEDDPLLFNLPRRNWKLWAIIMVAYPILSVFPQEVIWRTFYFHRYEPMLGKTLTIWTSAVSFALAHLLFFNWIAIAMTLVGGWLFARTYAATKSTMAACVEHALYGCLVFTIGLGSFFYSGPQRSEPPTEDVGAVAPYAPGPTGEPANAERGDNRPIRGV